MGKPKLSELEDAKIEQSLSKKVIKGSFWIFALRFGQKILSFVRLIILAKFLSPQDIGLMGIALLTLQTLETFSQTGLQAALIQKKEFNPEFLNISWTLSILRGFGLVVFTFLCAPFVAKFFNSETSKLLIQAIGFSFLFQGFVNIGVIYLQKDLEFNKQFVFNFVSLFTDFFISLLFIFILKNVWALVIGKIAGDIAKVIASYFVHPYRPVLNFQFKKAKELYNFGRWIFGLNILVFLGTQGDSIFAGRFFGAISLGFYRLASTISNMPTTEITSIVSQVTFPAYSKIQGKIDRIKEAYLKTLYLTGILSFFIGTLIFVLMQDFTKIFLGGKWEPIVPITKILVFAGLVRSIQAIPGPIFQAMGKPKIDAMWQIIRVSVLGFSIYPLSVKFGVNGVSVSVLLSILITCFISHYTAVKTIKPSRTSFYKIILIPAAVSLVTIFLCGLLRNIVPITGLLSFVLFFIFGALVYLGALYFIDKKFSEYKVTFLLSGLFTKK